MSHTYINSDSTFFHAECVLCRQTLDLEDVDSFLAVSACHPYPGRAVWKDVEGLRLLCIGRVAASRVKILGELPSIYLVHSSCYEIIKIANRHRTVFECFRALGPILHGPMSSTLRMWPWSSSCVVYGPALHKVLSGVPNSRIPRVEAASLEQLQARIQTRLHAITRIKKRLPVELSDMILDYLPFELALALDAMSGGQQCLRRLRGDPIAQNFERAFEVLGQEVRVFKHANNIIKLVPEMRAQFMLVGNQWYLQDLVPATKRTDNGEEKAGQVKQLLFKHNRDRAPYVAVQVDEFGITRIALDAKAGQPRWISPNTHKGQLHFFQDSSSDSSFDSVAVISDGLKLCAVDIISHDKGNRTRAVLPSHVSGHHWSLSPYDSLYVRPDIIDLTRACGLYAWVPCRMGAPGLRLSHKPQPGFNELRFATEGEARTIQLVHVPSSPVVSMLFHQEQIDVSNDTTLEIIPNVVGVWQFNFACNVVTTLPPPCK